MASQLQKGHTYNPGDVVDAADLNSLVDSATALAGLITDPAHGTVNASSGDKVLLSRGGFLKQADVSTFPSGITSVHLSATPATVFNVTGTPTITTSGTFGIELDDQAPNKVLAGPVSGSDATPSFRLIKPVDVNKLITVAALTIDLDQGNTFFKSLTVNSLLRLKNGTPGQVIKVIVIQGGAGNFTVAWTPDDTANDFLRWPGGTPPVMTTGGAGRTDIYEFTLLQTGTGPNNYYGIRWGANFDL